MAQTALNGGPDEPVTSCAGRGGSGEKSRQTAVMFVDMVDYSRHVGEAPMQTLARWRDFQSRIAAPSISANSGRVIRIIGDQYFLEFPTPNHAMMCAISLQAGAEHDNIGRKASERIDYRIGMHWGTVIDLGTDIFGDDVNIAARLEKIAEPGCVVVSAETVKTLESSIANDLLELGAVPLKNIARPVVAYQWSPKSKSMRKRYSGPFGSSDYPSVAVMPFTDHGEGGDRSYFGDGLIEDIITSLASLREMFVISRGSTLGFPPGPMNAAQVARILNVKYVVSGSIVRQLREIRVKILLENAVDGITLWSDEIVGVPDDLFAIQDKVVEEVVKGIAPEIRASELRAALVKKPQSFSSYDSLLRAIDVLAQLDRDSFDSARNLLLESVRTEPEFSTPLAWLARWHSIRVGQGWSPAPLVDAREAIRYAKAAVKLDPTNALALAICGHAHSFLLHDYESGLSYLQQAQSLCPNQSLICLLHSGTLSFVGRGKEAIELAVRGLRLSPLDRHLFNSYSFLAMAHYMNGDFEQAAKWGRQSIMENPSYSTALRFVAASLVALGQIDAARETAARVVVVEPDFALSRFVSRIPFAMQEIKDQYIDRLRLAGLPD